MQKQYIGTKIITAWPEEKDGREGYGVRYADGYKAGLRRKRSRKPIGSLTR